LVFILLCKTLNSIKYKNTVNIDFNYKFKFYIYNNIDFEALFIHLFNTYYDKEFYIYISLHSITKF